MTASYYHHTTSAFLLLLLFSLYSLSTAVHGRCFNYIRHRQQQSHSNGNSTHIPVLISHRGSRYITSENTIRAFDTVLQLGTDVIELDVRLTADNELVVMHDHLLDRTSNVKETALWRQLASLVSQSTDFDIENDPVALSNVIHVRNYTAEQLEHLDAAYHFTCGEGYPLRGHGIRIPRFQDVLSRYWGDEHLKKPGEGRRRSSETPDWKSPHHVFFNVELKDVEEAAIDRMAEILDAYDDEWVAEHMVVVHADCKLLNYFRERTERRIPTGACEGEALWFMVKARLTATLLPIRELLFGKLRQYDQVPDTEKSMHPCALQIPTFVPGAQMDFKELVMLAHHEGMQVHYWVINSPREMTRLVELGADALFTDRTDLAVEWMRQSDMNDRRWRTMEDPYVANKSLSHWACGIEDEPWECIGLLCHTFEYSVQLLAPSMIVLISWLSLSSCWRRSTSWKGTHTKKTV